MVNVFTRQSLTGRLGRMEQLASIRRYAIEDGNDLDTTSAAWVSGCRVKK